MSIVLGYAGFNATLRPHGIFVGRTARIETIKQHGINLLIDLSLKNLDDVLKIIEWNEQHGLRFYRIGSDIFPHMENEQIGEILQDYNIDFARDKLGEIGDLARKYGHRITFHPKQFTQLGSPRTDVVRRSVLDLNVHAKIFKLMGLKPSMGSVMIIHGGGSYGDKRASLDRWKSTFIKMDPETQQYIVLENDEQYSVLDLLPICEELKIPLCIDYFHHTLYDKDPDGNSFDVYDEKIIQRVINIWKLRGIKPKCHWSQQEPNSRRGTHSTEVTEIDPRVLCVCSRHGCDIVIESKNKDINVLHMYNKYFYQIHNPADKTIRWTLRDEYICK